MPRLVLLALALLAGTGCSLNEARLRGITASMVDASFDVLTEEERRAVIEEQTVQLVRAIAGALEEDLAPDLEQALTESVRGAVAGALDEALDPKRQGDAAAWTRALIDASSGALARGLDRDLGTALQRTLADRIGPAIAASVEEQLVPAMARATEAHLQPLAASTARQVSREAAAGFADALDAELGEALSRQGDRMLAAFDARLDKGGEVASEWGRTLGLLAGVLGLGLGIALLVLRRVFRDSREARASVELMTALIREAAREEADVPALVSRIKQTGARSTGGDWLERFLDERPHLKAPKPEAAPPEA